MTFKQGWAQINVRNQMLEQFPLLISEVDQVDS